jgi:hypothetical protein
VAASCTVSGLSKSPCLDYNSQPETIDTIFTREIIIQDELVGSDPTQQKKVLVRVNWTDASGAHKSDLVTILSK